ncbi:MAG: alpha-L-fucosidase [Gemmatimonadetes bacterium 13_2_20CM_69_27]|nr:MAG: alpha-L-fucosidase [Gemmatimonadetes bacterium 13_2_20CM_69_27]OLB60280.1 MAG: alpha-L-fucosidase [Gemmatimonadetes bacterium 13_2_20CM_2_69_23]OLD59093.1 MAG: alpha-L-fucosidase [Gemmatimonadetes bacterium 13_1_20CM_69_28]PYO30180.1 MAG: alpha-L-fucosidase [Gemmatimonadota bacterium]
MEKVKPGVRPHPSASQLAWQRDELALFLHFGVNTFTDREWGDGHEDPAIFDPTQLDARQWARTAKAGGARALILTAKHHDGFCLWSSRLTEHSVARSAWRGGAGDVVREFTDACRSEELRAGLYLSPWDRNAPVYGDSPRYNDFYCDQLTELLTRYGPISEVWFDGANGEGPNGRRQVYDWPRIFGLVRRLQPRAVMFSDAGPDVRWCGNEAGVAGDPNWSSVDPAAVPYPGASGGAVIAALQHGDPHGAVWRPAETDTSIRPGWFYHAAEDERVKPVDQLVGIWLTSVGRNSKLLLNVPPTRDGVLHATDVARLAQLRAQLTSLFAEDFAAGRPVDWRVTGRRTAVAHVDLGKAVTIGLARLEEDIARGQCVARYAIQGTADGRDWRELARGTTVGYRKVDRFEPTAARNVRVVVEDAVATPRPLRFGLYRGA